jgi:hypothetical protein
MDKLKLQPYNSKQGGLQVRRNRRPYFKIDLRDCVRIKRKKEMKGNRGLSGKPSS